MKHRAGRNLPKSVGMWLDYTVLSAALFHIRYFLWSMYRPFIIKKNIVNIKCPRGLLASSVAWVSFIFLAASSSISLTFEVHLSLFTPSGPLFLLFHTLLKSSCPWWQRDGYKKQPSTKTGLSQVTNASFVAKETGWARHSGSLWMEGHQQYYYSLGGPLIVSSWNILWWEIHLGFLCLKLKK